MMYTDELHNICREVILYQIIMYKEICIPYGVCWDSVIETWVTIPLSYLKPIKNKQSLNE